MGAHGERPHPSAESSGRGSPRSSSSAAHSARNRRFTPGSLKRLAMVGKHRHLGVRQLHAIGMIAAPLLAHVAQRVFGAALLELVQHDHVGEVEHVDLLELARRAVFGGHRRTATDPRDRRSPVSLWPMPAVSTTIEVEARRAIQRDHIGEHGAGRQVLAARGQRAHEHAAARASEFMRMRSPNSAPPERRRVGSMRDHRHAAGPGTGAGTAAAARR